MRRLIVLVGGALLSACSLSGLVFDLGGAGGGGSSSIGGGVASSSSGGAGGGIAGSSSSMPTCMSTSTSGAGGGVENCTNGVDDDNDGMVDCADPDCMSAGYICNDVPMGWLGPVAFFEGAPTDNPCCPSDYPTLGLAGGTGPTGGPFTCSACSCLPAVATCTPAALVSHTMVGCVDVGSSTPQQDGACHPVSGSFVQAAAPTVTVGQCAHTGGTPLTQPIAGWTAASQLCTGGNMGMGCAAAQVCARPAGGVFGNRLCVYAAGVQPACPAGFPVMHSFFAKLDDTRACAACTCGAAVPPACTVTSSVYSSANCSGGVNKLIVNAANSGGCIAAPGAASFKTTVAVGSGTCTPMGGGATGMVTGATGTETTVCCTQ